MKLLLFIFQIGIVTALCLSVSWADDCEAPVVVIGEAKSLEKSINNSVNSLGGQDNISSVGTSLTFLEVIIGSIAVLVSVLTTVGLAGGIALYSRSKSHLDQYQSSHEQTRILNESTRFHLDKLDRTMMIAKKRIDVSNKTLIRCLEVEGEGKKAFHIYGKLLEAYSVILNLDWDYEASELELNNNEDNMQIAATTIYLYKDYIPSDFIRFIVEKIEPPYSVIEILHGNG